jgi:hypothetical protein
MKWVHTHMGEGCTTFWTPSDAGGIFLGLGLEKGGWILPLFFTHCCMLVQLIAKEHVFWGFVVECRDTRLFLGDARGRLELSASGAIHRQFGMPATSAMARHIAVVIKFAAPL